MEPAATGMTAIINAIGSLVTAAGTWITSTVGVITTSGNELLLFCVIVGFVGVGIGLVKRVMKLRA